MYLLYIDESGQARGRKRGSSKYFVLSGVALHEEDVYPFGRSLDAIVRRAIPSQPDIEIHASPIWAARGEWARFPPVDRHALLDELFTHLGTWTSAKGRSPRYFAAAIHKDSNKGRDVMMLAHEELFARFDSCLTRFHRAGDSHRALVIADESSYEQLVQKLVPTWKRTGSRIGRLHSLVEVPLYVNSENSRLVQATDLVAWAVWQYYEHSITDHITRIIDHFDCEGGILHGLVHLIKRYHVCGCVACSSRRTSLVPRPVPKF
jgi:hypothetical protein